ncbi:dynamin family protein [Burkholderia sp. LMG 13014]|uniref:dynamin family protein n=1 Tax=Burkholderia sp. LMG 13014 TaxID=2709306 RepID=UPI001964FC38|nr:dynamin family protein [Burkholderia sp. LMG 13014]
MNRIDIIHNPFTVDTQFRLNGAEPAPGCKLLGYKESRLQTWVEKLFDELAQLFNGDERYEIVFTGVESDYLDIEEAAQAAIARGAEVTLKWHETASSESRLAAIRQLRQDAQAHADFKRFIERDAASRSFEEAFDKNFDVYVVATMSSGKSTLINAMLGRDLLPSGNEATTASIATITDNESIGTRFAAARLDKQERELERVDDAVLTDIQRWNGEADTYRIDIEGDIKGIRERVDVRLKLTDTPGPNNSQDEDHQRTTMSYIQDSKRNPLILYVLNAQQIGINDDRHLLGLVAEAMAKGGKQSKDRFIFVINKMDVFDPERENIPGVLKRVTDYLNKNGIAAPLIYPVSANLTRVMRMPADQQTRVDRNFFKEKAEIFEEEPAMNLLQYMPITSRVRRNLEQKQLSSLMLKSGLPAVESVIDEYIDKYNFPHRVKRAYDAMMHAIVSGLNEAEVNRQLDLDETMLCTIEQQIVVLKANQEKGFEVNEFRERMIREGLRMPAEIEKKLQALENRPRTMLREMAEILRGEVTVATAESKIELAEKTLRAEFNALINSYENEFEHCQSWISRRLQEEYQSRITALFADCGALNLPVFDSFLKQAVDMSVDLAIRSEEIRERRVVVGTEEVSDSRWYNPFSWGKKKYVDVVRWEKQVKLDDFWGERQTLVDAAFDELVERARGEIDAMKSKLTNQFVDFVGLEFDARFKTMLAELQEKLAERETREAAVAEARALQATIAGFKTRLDETLAV